ncbi:hypothetical protein D6825_01105 [Candidatus Woesearchaeota archaeon]|nr:MAG: hypothetical protein D6825_01105 [Candidatus Woesearchaeota archaeon]
MSAIRKKILDKIDQYTTILEHAVNPDPSSITDIYESKAFNNKDRQEALELFSKLTQINRLLLESDALAEDKMSAEAISTAVKEWRLAHTRVAQTIKKMRECWSETQSSEKIGRYFG